MWSWNRIPATLMPRIATQDAGKSKSQPPGRPVLLYRLDSIAGARRSIPTDIPKHRGKSHLVNAYRGNKHGCGNPSCTQAACVP